MGEREDVAVPVSRCPGCGYRMDSASQASGGKARPKAGDLTLCMNCGGALVFAKGLKLRPLTEGELWDLPRETRDELARVTAAIVQLRKQRAAQ